MADAHDLGRLGPPVVRTAWVFQALIVGPAFIFTGQELFWTMWQYYHESWLVYPALRYLGFGILTAGIIFVLIVQWSYSSPHPKAFRALETSKAIFATAAWLWLLLDAIAYIPDYYDPYCRFRRKKIVLTAVSVVVLLSVLSRPKCPGFDPHMLT